LLEYNTLKDLLVNLARIATDYFTSTTDYFTSTMKSFLLVLGIYIQILNLEGMKNSDMEIVPFMKPLENVLNRDYKHCKIDAVELIPKVGHEYIQLQMLKESEKESENRSKRSLKKTFKYIKYMKKMLKILKKEKKILKKEKKILKKEKPLIKKRNHVGKRSFPTTKISNDGNINKKRLVHSKQELSPRLNRLLNPRNELSCTLCTDIMTDIDNWITDEKSEAEIIAFVEQLCDHLGMILPEFTDACKNLMETQLPAIIDGLVNDNLDPAQVCTQLGLCP